MHFVLLENDCSGIVTWMGTREWKERIEINIRMNFLKKLLFKSILSLAGKSFTFVFVNVLY